MRHEYAKSLRKFDFILPLLDAWGLEKDSVMSRKTSASLLNRLYALNNLVMQFSVLNFFAKNAKCVFAFDRSLNVLSIRFRFILM